MKWPVFFSYLLYGSAWDYQSGIPPATYPTFVADDAPQPQYPSFPDHAASSAWTDPNAGWTDPNAGWTDPNAAWTDPNAAWTDPNATWIDPNADCTDPSGQSDPSSMVGVAPLTPPSVTEAYDKAQADLEIQKAQTRRAYQISQSMAKLAAKPLWKSVKPEPPQTDPLVDAVRRSAQVPDVPLGILKNICWGSENCLMSLGCDFRVSEIYVGES